ncbi:hypothetical protein MAUB1S_09966 [Mycolicibacterium aubagnense]
MTLAEFIDKVLTPLAAGLGMYLATRFSARMREQSNKVTALQVVAVVVIVGGLKWSNLV